MKNQEVIRGMQYAGSWYESDPDLLRAFIAESLADAELRSPDRKSVEVRTRGLSCYAAACRTCLLSKGYCRLFF